MELSTAAMLFSVVSTVGQVIGSITSARQNAAMTEAEAKAERQRAAYDEQQSRRETGLLMGKQQAIGAAAGLVPGEGSLLTQALDTAFEAEMEALNIRHGGEMRRFAKKQEAKMYRQSIPWTLVQGAGKAGSIFFDWYKGRSP